MCFAYAIDYELDEEQTEDLWYHIALMDVEFLEWWKKKQPKYKPGKGIKGGSKDIERSV